MRPIRTAVAATAATFESLGTLLSRHRALTRVALAALSFTLVIALGQQQTIQAGPQAVPAVPESLLPLNVGIAVGSGDAVTIPLETAMDPASVEAAVEVYPTQRVELAWDAERGELTIAPERLWRTDETYLVVVAPSSPSAEGEARRFAFTTQTAPVVTDFQVRLADADLATADGAPDAPGAASLMLDADASARAAVADAAADRSAQAGSQPPSDTATEVSATSAISISFSEAMDKRDVEEHFAISPAVAGELTWQDRDLVFTPTERLAAGTRYTVSLVGGHDDAGNPLGGKANFSFIVQAGAQLTTTEPKLGASGIEPTAVEMWFSQPMEVDAANAAFSLTDRATGAAVGGNLSWNDAGTQLTYVPDASFAPGATFEVAFGDGAVDADGNPVAMRWSFTTLAEPVAAPAAASAAAAPSVRSAAPVVVPPPAPASDAAGYAVNQINAARAAYGFGPVVLDEAISAVAYGHAYDQAINGYFSHTGLDGSTRESRLAAGGIGFGWSGENQCYLVGRSVTATLDWCHASFMAEPYPGHWNHIANVLNPNAHRVGVGIAQVGGKLVIVWDFTD